MSCGPLVRQACLKAELWRTKSLETAALLTEGNYDMGTFESAGVQIYYEEYGAGAPVVLIHGFASNIETNWVVPGWIELLAQRFWTIPFDLRGHGRSSKPHDWQAYTMDALVGDVVALLDHLKVDRTFIMGYSLGGRITLELLVRHPERVRAAVVGGVGRESGISSSEIRQKIVDGLLAPSIENVTDELARRFRRFAEANKNDLKALAACMSVARAMPPVSELSRIKAPVLVVAGANDTWIGSPQWLRDTIPNAQLVILEGRDHMTAVGDKRFKEEVLRFFAAADAQ